MCVCAIYPSVTVSEYSRRAPRGFQSGYRSEEHWPLLSNISFSMNVQPIRSSGSQSPSDRAEPKKSMVVVILKANTRHETLDALECRLRMGILKTAGFVVLERALIIWQQKPAPLQNRDHSA